MRFREAPKERPVRLFFHRAAELVLNCLLGIYWRVNIFGYLYRRFFKPSKTFKFQNGTYGYFHHYYNTTWKNERAVEIPIVWRIVKKHQGGRILHVGNVLPHYFDVDHDVLDKYERADGVINEDVVEFDPAEKYDLIVSVSTLEHVGWDEEPREPLKVLKAIENLKQSLKPEGKLVVTLPLGQNAVLDSLIKKKKIEFSEMYCLKRISEENEWVEVGWDNVKDAKYNEPFSAANGLVVGVITAQNS